MEQAVIALISFFIPFTAAIVSSMYSKWMYDRFRKEGETEADSHSRHR